MKLELKWPSTAAERVTLEGEGTSVAAVLLFWVEWILSMVILLAHFWKYPNFISNFSFRISVFFPLYNKTGIRMSDIPSSVSTSLAAAMSMNFFSAFFFSSSSWKLSGCHFCASFLKDMDAKYVKKPDSYLFTLNLRTCRLLGCLSFCHSF